MPPEPDPYIIREFTDEGVHGWRVVAQYYTGIHCYHPSEVLFEGGILECEAYIRLREKGLV